MSVFKRKRQVFFWVSALILGMGLFAVVNNTQKTDAAVGINKTINFQGKMTNSNGTNVADGTYTFDFALYTVGSGGTALWTETSSLTVDDGVFQVNLGAVTPLPGSVDFNTDNIFLGITFNSDPDGEMTPRIQLTASPYAFNADKLDGLDSTALVQLTPSGTQTGSIDISGNVSSANGVFNTSVLVGTTSQFGSIAIYDGSSDYGVLLTDALSAPRAYTLPDADGEVCLDSGNCGSGVTTVGALNGGTANANAATITGSTIFLQSASASFAGVVSTAAQTFAGNKTFNDTVTIGSNLTVDTNTLFVDATNNRVGIGTATPGSPLDILGAFNGDFELNIKNSDAGSSACAGQQAQNSTDRIAEFGVCNDNFGSAEYQSRAYFGSAGNADGISVIAYDPGADIHFYTGGLNQRFVISASASTLTGGGATTIAGGTSLALQASSGGISLVSSGTNNVSIGTSDTTGTQLILDTKTGSGDPTGLGAGFGTIYYNSNAAKLRCYEGSTWKDCITAGGGGSLFTDAGAYTYLTATGDEVVLGSSSQNSGVKLTVTTGGANATGGYASTLANFRNSNNSTDWAGVSIQSGISGGAFLSLGDNDAADRASLVYDNNTELMSFYVNGSSTSSLDINSSGGTFNGTLTVGGNILPGSSFAYNLGANASRFNNIYTDGLRVGFTTGDEGIISYNSVADTLNFASAGNISVGTADATGTLLVLDSKSGTAEGAGITGATNGAMYYNSTDNKFRCYEASTWKDCIGASSGALVQVPATTAANTITPTAASVVGLTVNGTSSTTATALNVVQSLTGAAQTIGLTSTTGTQTAGMSITRSGAGGTTTSLLELTQSGGTATNGILFTGTIGTDITTATNRALTINSNGTGTMNFGSDTGAKTINIGTGGTGVKTIAIGGSAANVITIGNTQTAGSISLGAGMTGGTISIGGTGAQTGAISLGTGTGVQIINLATGGTGAKTVTLGSTASTGATTIQSGTGNIILQASTTGTIARVQIGAGGAGSTTPDFLALDVKSTTGDPAGGAEGYMYYNTFDNKFRCFQGAAWTDCIGAGGGGSLFTDGGTATYLTATTDELVVGSSTSASAKLAIVGTSDQTQLLVRANATQTNPLVLFQSSAGSERARLHADAADNLLFGYQALMTNSTGTDSIAIGTSALQDNSSGTNNIALGSNAMIFSEGGDGNIALGADALQSNQGDGNIALGVSSLRQNTTGNNNIALGADALQENTTSSDNIAIGASALYAAGTGGQNVAIGYQALNLTDSGSLNVAVGYRAGDSNGNFNNDAARNTFLGAYTGYNINDADNNTLIGYGAGEGITGGDGNILLGYQAGNNITTGLNNIVIGYDIDAASDTGSNQLNIAGLLTSTDYTTAGLTVNGTITYTNGTANTGAGTNGLCRNASGQIAGCTSSGRFKDDVEASPYGLDTLRELQPVIYIWNTTGQHDIGFIAEQVAVFVPEAVTYDLTGEVSSFNFNAMTAIAIAGVKELDQNVQVVTGRLSVVEQTVSGINITSSNQNNILSLINGIYGRLNVLEQGQLAAITVAGAASVGGNLTVTGDTFVKNLTIAGKIVTTGSLPTATLEAAGTGTDGGVVVSGNDTAGTLTYTAGTASTAAPLTAGKQLTLTFTSPFAAAPRVNLTAASEDAALVRYFTKQTKDGFSITFIDPPAAGKEYTFNYFVVQ